MVHRTQPVDRRSVRIRSLGKGPDPDCGFEAEADERPIQVRRGKGHYVLVKGVHRLEARKALGEETIQAYIVRAQPY